MKTLQINVGLNNNPMNEEQTIEYFASLQGYRLMAYQIVNGEFNGQIEPTFVGLFEYKYARQSKIISDFENIANLMEQESIAISTDFMDTLVFNTSYIGEPYKFSTEFFKTIKI